MILRVTLVYEVGFGLVSSARSAEANMLQKTGLLRKFKVYHHGEQW